jgi:hypothetical protein
MSLKSLRVVYVYQLVKKGLREGVLCIKLFNLKIKVAGYRHEKSKDRCCECSSVCLVKQGVSLHVSLHYQSCLIFVKVVVFVEFVCEHLANRY